MMLNARLGWIATGSGIASLSQSDRPFAAVCSSRTTRQGSCAETGSRCCADGASTNNSRAEASISMVSRLSALADGASGATATPARKAPRNTIAYSMELSAQIAMASPGPTPSRCNAAATSLMRASSWAKFRRRVSWISAAWSGRCAAQCAMRSGMAAKAWSRSKASGRARVFMATRSVGRKQFQPSAVIASAGSAIRSANGR